MTRPLPPEETRFKPGKSGNEGGRPKLPEDIKQIRKISQFEFERIINKYLFMTDDEFSADVARPEITKFERAISGVLSKAIRKQDERTLEWILARTLGKMRERLEVESKSLKVNVQTTAALPTLEQLALENPDLTPAQLQSFAEKLSTLRSEIAASNRFGETMDIPALEAADDSAT